MFGKRNGWVAAVSLSFKVTLSINRLDELISELSKEIHFHRPKKCNKEEEKNFFFVFWKFSESLFCGTLNMNEHKKHTE